MERHFRKRVLNFGGQGQELAASRLHGEEFDSSRARRAGCRGVQRLGGDGYGLELRGEASTNGQNSFELRIGHAHIDVVEFVKRGGREVAAPGNFCIAWAKRDPHGLVCQSHPGCRLLVEAVAQMIDTQDVRCDGSGAAGSGVGGDFYRGDGDWGKTGSRGRERRPRGGMSEIGHGGRRGALPWLGWILPRGRWFLYAWPLKLEIRDSGGAAIFGSGEMLEGFADALMVALPVVTAAEVLVEEAPQRPEIFSAILAAQKRRSFLRAVFIISEKSHNKRVFLSKI